MKNNEEFREYQDLARKTYATSFQQKKGEIITKFTIFNKKMMQESVRI